MDDTFIMKHQLKLMMLTDHYSGAFFPLYYTDQQILSIADFLFIAWSPKEDPQFIFHGLPEMLLIDNDKALHSYALQRLFKYLKIDVPHLRPYHPEGKGGVEKHIDIWQRWFESTFLLQDFRPSGIKQVNQWAMKFAMDFQYSRIHTRHGKTRFEKWNEGIKELRELPSWEIYEKLIYSEPKVCTVKNGIIRFEGLQYKISGINNTKVDVFIFPFQYDEHKAITVQYPSKTLNLDNFLKTEIQTVTLLPVHKNKDGFRVETGTKFKEKHGELPKTKTQVEFEKVEKTELPEADEKKSPFELLVEKPFILPRKGRTVEVKSEIDHKDIEFNKHQAKKRIVSEMGRKLHDSDIAILDGYGKETFTEKEIDEIIARIRTTEAQLKQKEA